MSDRIRHRPARPDDWSAIWVILRDVAAQGDTFTYPVDLDEQAGAKLWSKSASRSEILVAIDGCGKLVGSAKVGANHQGPGDHVATASFIVAAGSRGLGIGRRIVEASLEWARSQGFAAMQFNAVASSNVAAIELYRSMGFDVVGSIPGAFRHPALGNVALLVMHRQL